jgi:hypothetical protein
VYETGTNTSSIFLCGQLDFTLLVLDFPASALDKSSMDGSEFERKVKPVQSCAHMSCPIGGINETNSFRQYLEFPLTSNDVINEALHPYDDKLLINAW